MEHRFRNPGLNKATICYILVSHPGLSLKCMRAGGHYHYVIIHPPQKEMTTIQCIN